MNKNLKLALIIVSAIFAITGIVLLGISIFTEQKNNTYLSIALVSVVASNILNVVRTQISKKDK